MSIVRLSDSVLREIIEKTVDFLQTQMIETTENNFIITHAKIKSHKFMRLEVIKAVLHASENYWFAERATVEPSIEWNLNKIKELMQNGAN